MVGGPELAGRGVIVHYPADGARRLPSVHASSYVIADAGSGQVLAAEDPHRRLLPAPLKELTADALVPVLKPDAAVVTSARPRTWPRKPMPGQGTCVPGV